MVSKEYMRVMIAKQEFKINSEFKFIEFEDITGETITKDMPTPDQVEILAAVKVGYTGEEPESYKTLNLIIGDWVEENIGPLTEIIHKNLAEHFEQYYPGSDTSELDEGTTIWLEQLDYMPRIDPENKSIIIEIELVMDTEEC